MRETALLLTAMITLPALTSFGTKTIHKPKYLLKSNPMDSRINIRAKRQIVRNLQDFESLLKTAEGYLGHCHKKLQKARQLTVKGANGVFTLTDRSKMIKEIHGLILDNFHALRHALFNCKPVFGKKLNGKTWRVPLTENSSAFAATLSAEDIIKTLKRIRLKPTVTSFNSSITRIDSAISAVSMERARIGAYMRRIKAAGQWQMLYVKEYNRLDKNEKIPNLKSGQLFHIRKLEDRLFELAVQGANSIYLAEDRRHLKLEWDQIILELKRLESETGIKTLARQIPPDAITSRATSEREMLRIAKQLLRNK